MKANTIGKYRWVIVALLLFALTINYVDRQVIGYLKEFFCRPTAKGGFGWSEIDYSNVIGIFILCYACISSLTGWIIDKIGTKLGLALSLITWSVFGILNAFAGSAVLVHIILRGFFGIGEAGGFPAVNKTIAEWFPKKERALAFGIVNSGTNLGAMIAALFVPWCLIYFGDQLGWKMAYILTGSVGFLWLIFWFRSYDHPLRHKKLSKEEFAYIHSDDANLTTAEVEMQKVKVPWLKLFQYRQAWAFFLGKFMTDGVWWFYLFWLPDYLRKQFGMDKHEIMLPTFIVYGISIIGSIYGGAIPLRFMNKGWHVYKARMTALLIMAFFPLSILSAQFLSNKEIFGSMASVFAVAVICIAAAAHQAWSTNIFTTVSDMFPKKAIASVTGIGAAAGGLGGYVIAKTSGFLNEAYLSHPQTAYLIMFIFCGLTYLLAWGIMKLLVPKFKPITDL